MKKLLKILGGLVALVIVAAIALPMLVSADYIKSQLQAQVKSATGRTLEIKGKAGISVFPNIAVNVEDVTLGNPAGFASPYLVHVEKLETGAALMPLLSKQLRITGFTLVGAKLNLEQNASGAKNWEFASAATPEKQEATHEKSAKESPLKQLAIGTVTIKNTAVTFSKPGTKPMLVEGINLSLKGADGASPLALNGSLNYMGQPVKITLAGDTLKAMTAGKESPLKLALELPSTTLEFDGKAALNGTPTASGNLTFGSTSLPKLLSWATGKPASAGLPNAVQLNTRLAVKGAESIALNDLKLSVDALKASGKLGINLSGAVPAIAGELAIPLLDMNALSHKNPSGAPAGGASSSADAGWSNAPIDASGLRAVNANLKLAIGKLISGKIQVSDIVTTMALNAGKLSLGLGNASLYGGAAKGTVSLDGSGAGVGLATNLALNHIDLDALMTAMSGASKLKGIANLAINLNGRGASQRALVGTLGGTGSMKINDGAIKGINIASFLRDAKKGFVLGDGSTQSTDFTELTASYSIAQGVLSNNDLAMKSPVLRLAGKGTVNLPARTIDYRAVPTIVGTLQGQGGKDKLSGGGLDIPLLITGPWSAISVTPDLEGMVTNALKDPAALQQNIKDIGANIGKLNSPKDIAGALLGGGAKPAAAPATTAGQPAAKPNAADAIGGLLNQLGK